MTALSLSATETVFAQNATWSGEGVFLSNTRIETLKRRVASKTEPTFAAYIKLQQFADKALDRQAQVPERWYVPGYYRDAQGHKKAKNGLADDANSAYALALMYRLGGDEKHAAAAARLIDAWGGLKELDRKDDSTLSFSYHFPALIFAAGLLKNWPGWPSEKQEAFKAFVHDKAMPMNTMNAENNWGSWGAVLWLAGAAYTGDKAAFAKGVARWKTLLGIQVAPDGHLPREVIRNNGVGEHGLWYTHFSLMPLAIAAEIVRLRGENLFDFQTPDGRNLRIAFERVVPWTRDPQIFPYFKPKKPEDKQVAFDYISYWEILNAHWPNTDATALLEKMRPLTATHSAPFLTFTHGGLLNDAN